MTRREQIISLWKTCFQDTEEFIQFYFNRKYEDENALLYTENGIPKAASLMLPYLMTWQNTIVSTSYISGACTHPQARKQGLMTRLLQEGFKEMYRRGIAFSTLIPAEDWLYDFYARLGYAPVFHQYIAQYESTPVRPEIDCTVEIMPSPDSSSIALTYPYFSRYLHARPCCILHSPDDYQDILTDLYMAGGCLAITHPHHQPTRITGLAFALPENDKLIIKEMATDTPDICHRLLHTLSSHWNLPIPTYPIPPTDTTRPVPFGMARIICLQPLLEHLATRHPRLDLTLQVTDTMLPENQGTYILSEGHCQKTCIPKQIQGTIMDISTLTRYLLEYGDVRPHMSLMLE